MVAGYCAEKAVVEHGTLRRVPLSHCRRAFLWSFQYRHASHIRAQFEFRMKLKLRIKV